MQSEVSQLPQAFEDPVREPSLFFPFLGMGRELLLCEFADALPQQVVFLAEEGTGHAHLLSHNY